MINNNRIGCVVLLLLALLLMAGFVVKIYLSYGTQEQVTVHVIRAERVNHSRSGVYLIFTDNETFCIKDNWLLLRCSSSDDYGKIVAGKTYTFTVCGWRIPLFSWYRNIIKINEPAKIIAKE